ncbi:hypothetical protein JNJ66_04600 [Candidatus Saccharibacteria bacterium]|nr:hypothetical protein [Candidatus Saccharibacteria bacterium]
MSIEMAPGEDRLRERYTASNELADLTEEELFDRLYIELDCGEVAYELYQRLDEDGRLYMLQHLAQWQIIELISLVDATVEQEILELLSRHHPDKGRHHTERVVYDIESAEYLLYKRYATTPETTAMDIIALSNYVIQTFGLGEFLAFSYETFDDKGGYVRDLTLDQVETLIAAAPQHEAAIRSALRGEGRHRALRTYASQLADGEEHHLPPMDSIKSIRWTSTPVEPKETMSPEQIAAWVAAFNARTEEPAVQWEAGVELFTHGGRTWWAGPDIPFTPGDAATAPPPEETPIGQAFDQAA